MIIEGKGPDGNPKTIEVDADGKLLVEGSISIDASDINIGNVDIVTLPALAAGTNAIGKLTTLPGLDIPTHDYVACSYTGSDLTGVVYKTGGSSGTTVATLTLAYTDGKLTSVTKS